MAFDSIENASFSIALQQLAKKAAAGLLPRQERDVCLNKINWTLGTGADQINAAYVALLTIAASGNQVLDLTALTDTLGNPLSFTYVKSIFIQLLGITEYSADGVTIGTAASGLVVGNATSNQFGGTGYPFGDLATSTITLANREQFGRAKPTPAGWLVDATHKSLKFLNGDAVFAAKVLVGMQGY